MIRLLSILLLWGLVGCDRPSDDGSDNGPTFPDAQVAPGPPGPRPMDGGVDKPVSCGGQVCGSPDMGLPLCCTGEGTGVEGNLRQDWGTAPDRCGVALSVLDPGLPAEACVEFDRAGDLSDGCPAGGMADAGLPGCCTDEGYCGVLVEQWGLGCTYLGLQRGLSCTPDEPVHPGGDGGTGDAGG